MADLIVTFTDRNSRTIVDINLNAIGAFIDRIVTRAWPDVVLGGRYSQVETRHPVEDITEITIRL